MMMICRYWPPLSCVFASLAVDSLIAIVYHVS